MGEEGRIGGGWGGVYVPVCCDCASVTLNLTRDFNAGRGGGCTLLPREGGEVLLLLLTYSLFLFTSCKHIAAWALSHKE